MLLFPSFKDSSCRANPLESQWEGFLGIPGGLNQLVICLAVPFCPLINGKECHLFDLEFGISSDIWPYIQYILSQYMKICSMTELASSDLALHQMAF